MFLVHYSTSFLVIYAEKACTELSTEKRSINDVSNSTVSGSICAEEFCHLFQLSLCSRSRQRIESIRLSPLGFVMHSSLYSKLGAQQWCCFVLHISETMATAKCTLYTALYIEYTLNKVYDDTLWDVLQVFLAISIVDWAAHRSYIVYQMIFIWLVSGSEGLIGNQ